MTISVFTQNTHTFFHQKILTSSRAQEKILVYLWGEGCGEVNENMNTQVGARWCSTV